jgi:hypothetical protein
MEIKPIRISINAGLSAKDDAEGTPNQHFRAVAAIIQAANLERHAGATNAINGSEVIALLSTVSDFLALMARIDDEYGADGILPIEGVSSAVDEALRALVDLESWVIRFNLPDQISPLHAIEIGVGYWAMRHEILISTAEAIVNALAAKSNGADSTQETAAIYAMMQGFIRYFSPALEADLERSNPERPWRLLNLNFAITAIRTGDADLMRYAFDTLNSHLPDETKGFYEEASALASQPGFPLPTRAVIDAELARWTRAH